LTVTQSWGYKKLWASFPGQPLSSVGNMVSRVQFKSISLTVSLCRTQCWTVWGTKTPSDFYWRHMCL